MIQRGKLYWINLDPAVGHEIKKTRPCLVISNNQANTYSSVVTVVPITSNITKIYPFEVALQPGEGGIKKASVIKVNQIKTVDKKRLDAQPLGPELSIRAMAKVAEAIKIHLDI